MAKCSVCGAQLYHFEYTSLYSCPNCGWAGTIMKTETGEHHNYSEKKKIPKGCKACGGPYPQCKSSCVLFDD